MHKCTDGRKIQFSHKVVFSVPSAKRDVLDNNLHYFEVFEKCELQEGRLRRAIVSRKRELRPVLWQKKSGRDAG